MSRTASDLSRLFDSAFPEPGPGQDLWEATQRSIRRRVRRRRVGAAVAAVGAVLALAASPVLWAQRTSPSVEFYTPPPEEDTSGGVPAPEHTEKPWYPSPQTTAEQPTAPSPEPAAPDAPGPSPTLAAEPARVEIRNHRLVLLDGQGRVLRTLYGDYDPAVHGLEYGMWGAAVRPGSTTRDLAATVVDGDVGGAGLRLVVVRDGGAAEVTTLASVDYEVTDHSPAAVPTAAWSPDGAFLAWLQPDAANRPVLRGLRWHGGAPAGDATAPGGSPVDPAGVAQADQATGLEVVGWQADPDQLVVRGHRPDGERLSYALPLTRADGQLRPGQLGRAE